MDTDDVVRMLLESDENSVGKLINRISTRYRRGAPLEELLPLLTHADSRVVAVAAWIVGEVADENRGREIFPQLSQLLEHSDPAVRFETLKSVARLVRSNEHLVVVAILRRLADENAGVRRQALLQVCLIPDSALSDPRILATLPEVTLLLDGVTEEQICSAIKADNVLVQRIAIAGALRNYGDDIAFMAKVEELCDTEVEGALPTLPRRRRF